MLFQGSPTDLWSRVKFNEVSTPKRRGCHWEVTAFVRHTTLIFQFRLTSRLHWATFVQEQIINKQSLSKNEEKWKKCFRFCSALFVCPEMLYFFFFFLNVLGVMEMVIPGWAKNKPPSISASLRVPVIRIHSSLVFIHYFKWWIISFGNFPLNYPRKGLKVRKCLWDMDLYHSAERRTRI